MSKQISSLCGTDGMENTSTNLVAISLPLLLHPLTFHTELLMDMLDCSPSAWR